MSQEVELAKEKSDNDLTAALKLKAKSERKAQDDLEEQYQWQVGWAGVFNSYSSSPNGLWVNSRGHEGERNNCFGKIQLVGQKYRGKKTLAS